MTVRIGKLVIGLDQCILQEVTDSMKKDAISVMTVTGQVLMTYFKDRDATEYHALKQYMERRETLANHNAYLVQNEYFDPFLDQMPVTLFTVFQSLHGSDEMTMELHNDGAGVVWRGKADQVEVLSWSNFDEGLRKLQELGKVLAEESQRAADLP